MATAKSPFGALQAGLDLAYSQSIVHFTWMGHEEMDEIFGDGHAELLDDGTIEITFTYHKGTKPASRRETSSPASEAQSTFKDGVAR
ncbi:MAG: hypothetical protein E5V49_07610 [Mesorhizobium sp.]|nr:hypothetical protein EN848_11220 [bacterium M00.F.Ca.ET.205.01.1.1]TGU55486.1 hypothetical protein EN795_01805 [bacterium M00.F.Ca.ET.152.01.1.1]TGV40231.1 hypothetical protein EN829_002635 [Mesorhizobium sp. M00.F.Ca.ET.186.01.1.1]TGZ45220.1 hypothetical protein EN805_02615 [bacterium M00.F.Ca.ET.162.01.1.1]TIW60654.1 MAG: hypothetical protein E5V48_12740 [Mesorhizobium sp.]